MKDSIEISNKITQSNNSDFFSQHTFRCVATALITWLSIGTIFLYQQELKIKFGLWDNFSINSINYSKFSDARDSEQVFQEQLILTQQIYRSGSLFIGPISLYSRKMLRIDNSAIYKMSLDIMTVSDGKNDVGSSIFAGVLFYDENKKLLAEPKTHMFGIAWNRLVKKNNGTVHIDGIFSSDGKELNKIPHNAHYFKVAIDLNYADPKAAVILSNVKFTPYVALTIGDNE